MSNNHFYYDVSDLNARWDQVPLQGLGGGILRAGPTGSLGADEFERDEVESRTGMPWKEYSAETLAAQKQLNVALKAEGFCAIDQDGKLGPGTCGAAQAVLPQLISTDCRAFTAPTKCGSGAPSAPPASPPPASPTAPTLPATMSGDNMWLIGGGVAALAAVGLAFFMKKKRK